jgi:phage portal protein BeeE
VSAWRILGPDGQPLVTSGGGQSAPTPSRLELSPAAREDLERRWASEVQKRVRSRATTMTVVDRERGRSKPTPVSFDTLRLMAQRNEWIRAITSVRKRQLAGKKWSIKVKDEDKSGAAAKAAKSLTRLLQRPQLHGEAPQSTTWRQFLGMYLDDLLVLDRACVEKERDGNGWIIALWNVDGATIRPNMDDRGRFERDAYVQLVDGMVEARFGMEELIVGIENPQTDVKLAGYGLSPLESLVISVTADLHAAKYNSSYFEKGSVPEGIFSLGEEIDPEDVDAFRLYWLNEVMGRPWALPIIGGSKAPEWIPLRENNRDMQFMEYQDWLLKKMCAVYQISPKEIGQIEDVNRSTAEDASQSDDEKGLEPLAAHVKDMIDLEIIGEHGQGLGDYLEFEWEQAGESAEAINTKFQPMVDSGAATRGEWRDAHGMDPEGHPDATHGKEAMNMHLSAADHKPLPSGQDADVLGAAAQQDREDEMTQDQWARDDVTADKDHQRALETGDGAGGATNVPWQPGKANDPKVRQAMKDHDTEKGIGVRNVGKTRPDRHPALTRAEDDLANEFDRASARLIEGLAQALGS